MLGSRMMHLLNRSIEKQSERIFDGISRGRKKHLTIGSMIDGMNWKM
ncbi:hypothetical protein NBRC111894_1544 [Sporolactobacillus inulinus]|uniref:Uncharacterized protein n=1 Tax=Sporolactobacillus inulinus TaxID=2078 RepID=A0A4Y1ZAC8_9BACL|nr:hypothetical protein [Sporolactobacillus inulinus]GAY75990.1 hypothetical protein NBRC111894_1544 [Sporolactobacillus inulinus]